MCEFDPECTGAHDLLADALDLIAGGHWAVTGVLGDTAHPPITYTSGLTEFGSPELVMTGLPPRLAGLLLNHAADIVTATPSFGAGASIPAHLRHRVALHAISVIDAGPLRLTRMLYGVGFEAVQLVWPDDTGRYPWQPGYAIGPDIQPLLGLPMSDAA